MNKLQLALIAAALLLIFGLSWLRTTPLQKKGENASAQAPLASLTDEEIIQRAKNRLDSLQQRSVFDLESAARKANGVDAQAEAYKQLSSAWNKSGNYTAGGLYAEKVAQLLQTDETWSIVGTTYGLAFEHPDRLSNEELAFCARRAIKAFDDAARLNPSNSNHLLNKGLMMVTLSKVDPSVLPMEGVQTLAKVAESDPNNLKALFALANFSITVGKFDKAVERLNAALAVKDISADDQIQAHSMLAYTYQQLGRVNDAVSEVKLAIPLASGEMKSRLEAQLEDIQNSK